MDAGHVDGDAVHLAFDEDGEVGFADLGFGFVEIEEDVALGVERGLGRVDVLASCRWVEGAGGEGDDLAGLVGDGEGDALAEARVHGAGGAVGLLLGAEEAAGAEDVFGKVGLEALAHVVEVVRSVADAEGLEGLGGDAAASEVLAGAGGLRGLSWASKYCVAASCRSISWRRRPASRASSGELKSRLGSGTPALAATARTASGKLSAIHLHHEVEDVAMLVAAEAVVDALLGLTRRSRSSPCGRDRGRCSSARRSCAVSGTRPRCGRCRLVA